MTATIIIRMTIVWDTVTITATTAPTWTTTRDCTVAECTPRCIHGEDRGRPLLSLLDVELTIIALIKR